MSKRPSTDLNSTKSKRAKRTLDISSQIDSSSDSSSQQSITNDSEHFIEFDSEEVNQLKEKTSRVLNKTPQELKITELTELFKEVLKSNTPQRLSSLFSILLEYLSFNSITLEDKFVSQISLLLSFQIDSLPLIVLKNSVDLFVSQIKSQKAFNEKCMELFVELFKFIQKLPLADLDKNQLISTETEKYTGNDYIHRKISEIFSAKWTQATAMNVLNLLKTIQLDQNELKLLLTKLFDINEINWPNTQIPSLINLILPFSQAKQNRSLIFEKILLFFAQNRAAPANQNNLNKSDFIDAETCSIMHIIHLIKTDPMLGKDLVKLLKGKLNRSLNELVQPFTFGFILSIIKVLPQDGVVELLKQIVIRIYESELKYKKYFWVAKCFSEEEKSLSNFLVKPSKCRLFFFENILQGFMEFLFDLLDSNGVRMIKNSKPVSLNEHVTAYASEMIRDIFRNVNTSRENILNQLTERIFSSTVNKSIVFIDQLSILIQSEPASSFQDYFRKFKGKLDHMIYMAPIVALEFLTSIKPLLKYDSIYKDNLIITLKKSIYQSDLDVRKVGLNGLICLLTQTKLSNFLPSSQASQSMSLSQSQSQVSRMTMSQEKNSEKNCLEIFLSLRRCLTQQVDIRSRLYQSCCNLVVQNTTLIGPTLNLLLINFENYLIKTNYDLIVDFSKCLKLNELGEIELVEPLDVLMHSLHLCDEKFVKMNLQSKFQDQLDEDIKKHSDLIKTYFEQLKQNFLSQNSQYIIETYKSQVASMILSTSKNLPKTSANQTTIATQKQTQRATQKLNQTSLISNNSTDLSTSMAFYQCLLGSIEILIEHFFSLGYLKATRDLYKKFIQVYDLVHKQFLGTGEETNTKSKKPNQTPSKTQKKKAGGKKVKKENKENVDDEDEDGTNQDDDIRATAYDQSKIADLTTIEQQPLLESTTNAQNSGKNAKKSKVSANAKKLNAVKFNYIHRVSYSCMLKILQIYFSDEKRLIKTENQDDYIDETLEEFLLQVKVDDHFHNYLMKVLNQQLDLILNEASHLKTNAKTNYIIYDAEAYNDKDLFKFLNQIWIECSNQNFYCEECIKSKGVYIKILNNIWKIVALKFNPKLNDLFSFSILDESQNESIVQSNTSTIAVGILDQCRRFIDRCLSSQAQYVQNSYKLATQILDLMHDISSSSKLDMKDYGVLFKWTQAMANERGVRDQIFIKSLLKYFIYITWNKNSSATLMKYLCQELIHVYGINHLFKSYIEDLSSIETIFGCVSDETSSSMIGVICDELSSQMSILEWFISFKTDKTSILSFYKQLNCVLECIKILLIIDLPPNSPHDILIKFLSKFYNFMIAFCKSILTRDVAEDEEKMLKAAVDFTAKQLQTPLSYFIHIIQNAKSTNLKDGKGGKAEKGKENAKQKGKDSAGDSITSSRVIKCTKMIPNLVYLYEQYEQQLKLMNKHFQNRINFTENIEIRLKDFKIDLSSQNDQSEDEEMQEGSYSPSVSRENIEETNEETGQVEETQNGSEVEDDDDESEDE